MKPAFPAILELAKVGVNIKLQILVDFCNTHRNMDAAFLLMVVIRAEEVDEKNKRMGQLWAKDVWRCCQTSGKILVLSR